METLFRDIRYGLRSLIRRPAFTAIVIVTLALGIGANTAVFSLVNATLLRPLPFKDPDQLVAVWGTAAQGNRRPVSEPNFLDYREQNQVFSQVAAFASAAYTLTGGASPERIRGARVSADFFNVLGVQPLLGQTFASGDDQAGRNAVAVLSYSLWQRRFGADQSIVGQKILIDAKPYTVVGVLPAKIDFSVPGYFPTAELWTPAALKRDEPARAKDYLRVIGRLKPGTSPEQAQAQMNAIAQRLSSEHPDLGQIGVRAVRLREEIVGDSRQMLLLLLGAVGFVLLIACANVANLQMARSSGRQKEFAVRSALGAGRWRLIRQLLTESLLLALLGGAVGVALAWLSVRLLMQPGLGTFAAGATTSLDPVVIVYALLISILTGILFGLAPAFQSSQRDLSNSLKEGGRGSGTSVGKRLRSLLTISEVALSLVLLVGAGLLLRSFLQLLKVETGFDAGHALSLRIVLPGYAYPNAAKQEAFFTQAIERVGSLPGVKAVGAINALPLTADRHSADFMIEGQTVADNQLPLAETRTVTPRYFQAMNIPLVAGRAFGEDDTSTTPPVVMINQSLAQRFFPNESPVGRRITFDAPPSALEWVTIVGVVQDVHDLGLDRRPEPEIYQPFKQNAAPFMNLVVGTTGDPRSLVGSVRNEISSLDKNLPVGVPEPMDNVLATSIATRRFNMIVLAVFASIAMLLAMGGIYGVMSYAVSQRTQEIGLRMAMGAQTSDILKMILSGGMKLTIIGIVIGLAGALWLTRLMISFLFGVTAFDVVTFVTVTVALIFVALLACYVPARRATKVDPLRALRYE